MGFNIKRGKIIIPFPHPSGITTTLRTLPETTSLQLAGLSDQLEILTQKRNKVEIELAELKVVDDTP